MKYSIKQAQPRWKDLPNSHKMSAYDYEKYMIKEHGFERKHLVGSIGFGTKTHTFSAVCRIKNKELHLVSCHSMCGSAKWTSALYIDPDQKAECDCKRCRH